MRHTHKNSQFNESQHTLSVKSVRNNKVTNFKYVVVRMTKSVSKKEVGGSTVSVWNVSLHICERILLEGERAGKKLRFIQFLAHDVNRDEMCDRSINSSSRYLVYGINGEKRFLRWIPCKLEYFHAFYTLNVLSFSPSISVCMKLHNRVSSTMKR